MPPGPTPQDASTEQMRIKYAFWLAMLGLGLAAALAVFLVLMGMKTASDVVAIVGLFTSVLGTLVGAFFGVQIGSAGKEQAQQDAQKANTQLLRAVALMTPDQARGLTEGPAEGRA